MKKFNVDKETFQQFLLELDFRYTNQEKTVMYSDEYGDMWIYFVDTEEVLSNGYTILNCNGKDTFNLAQFVKFLNERKDLIDSYNNAIKQASDNW